MKPVRPDAPVRGFVLRVSDEFLAAVRVWARANHRSMHQQIIHVVTESIAQHGVLRDSMEQQQGHGTVRREPSGTED